MTGAAGHDWARVSAPTRWVGALLAIAALAACGSGSYTNAPGALSPDQAEARLRSIVLDASDAGAGYTLDVSRVQTNEQAARARPDTAAAKEQHEAWGQALAYNVQFSAADIGAIVFSPRLARVMNTATIFTGADGASAALGYVRALSPDLLADALTNEGEGTRISDTQVAKDIAFAAKGDESFAWRVSGKATFADGFNISFIADTVFVRAGAVTGSITGVALGDAPDHAELERLVDRFIEKARGE